MIVYNKNKVDEITLALLYLTTFNTQSAHRCWKSFDWQTLDRLHEKGYISDPKSKAKSVVLSEQGVLASKELFERFFSESDLQKDQAGQPC